MNNTKIVKNENKVQQNKKEPEFKGNTSQKSEFYSEKKEENFPKETLNEVWKKYESLKI